MLESLDLAKEEIKRADHLMYVSLKYTRTVDILKSIIERLINAIPKNELEKAKIIIGN